MKKILSILVIMLFAITFFAQSPFYFNYQAAVRDNQNQILANQNVALKFSILENSDSGTVMYSETHNTKSSALGIVNLQIGKGQNQTGSLSALDWKNKHYWLKVEMDDTGGSNYQLMGITQLVSVPYALHAETATYVDDADANPNNEIQTLSKNGNTISLSKNGGSVTDEVNDADADATNELQILSFNTNSNELSISNGNSVTIPTGGTDADADPNNEIQTLSKNGNTISLSKNGGSVTDEVNDADADPANELQNLNLSGNTLSITNGNNIDLSSFKSFWTPTAVWAPNGIFHVGPVFMDTVMVDWQLKVGNNNPYGTQIYDKDFFMNDNVSKKNLQMNAGNLIFNEDANISTSHLSKDSLYFKYDPGGLLWPQIARYASNGLSLESLVNTSILDAYSLNINDDKYQSYWESRKWGIKEKLSNADIFDRISIEPDMFSMYNNAKWKYVQIGKDPDFGTGMLKIMDMGGNGEKAHIVGSDSYDGGGAMFHLIGADGNIKAEMESPYNIGLFSLYSQNNSRLLYGLAEGEFFGGGLLEVSDTMDDPQVVIWATRDTFEGALLPGDDIMKSMGHIYSSWDIFAPYIQSVIDDTINSEMSNLGFTTRGGFFINKALALKNEPWNLWEPAVSITNYNNFGQAVFWGKNGNMNVNIFAKSPGLSDNANYGAVYVYNDQGIAQAGIEVDPNTGQGIVWGNSKQFRIPYPGKSSKEIVYSSIEGPEAGIYSRGTSTLENGEAFIQLPDYFTSIASSGSMTVVLTPLDWDTYGLAVIEKSEKGFKVKELKGGSGNFSFDWEVKAVRKGYENFKVVRDKPNDIKSNTKQLIGKKQSYNRFPNKIFDYKK